MDELLFNIIKLLVIILITLVVRYGVPFLKQKLEDAKLSGVAKWVGKAVEAAEQTIKQPGAGVEKKAIVVKFLKEILTAKNISISDEQLNTLIEAAVFAMNKSLEGQG